MKQLTDWSPGKMFALLLISACAVLVFDLRYEHNHILANHEIGWTPIIYSGLMVLVGIMGLAKWEQWGRPLLTAVFAAGFVVGALGFWYHGQGHMFADLGQMLSVWGGAHPNPVHQPPPLAPLAFAGIGLAGILACSRHFSASVNAAGSARKEPSKATAQISLPL